MDKRNESWLIKFYLHYPRLFICGIFLAIFVYVLIIIFLLPIILNVIGVKYNDEQLGGIGSGILLLSIYGLIFFQKSKDPKSLFHSDKKRRIKGIFCFLFISLYFLSLPFVNVGLWILGLVIIGYIFSRLWP